MKTQISRMIIGIGILAPWITFADKIPENFPQELMYQNKPIDPLCFFEADKPSISLTECGIKADAERKITTTKIDIANRGFIGYDYIWPVEKNNPDQQANAHSSYKVIGKINDSYLIYALNNSGGSGTFSNIYLVKRENDLVHVSALASGDRCNGGINSVEIKNQKIVYNANVTPVDFYDLAKQKPKMDSNQGELAYCAVCCVATANIEISPTEQRAELISVDLDKNAEANTQGKYQSCFNELIDTYKKDGKTHLNPQQLSQFMQEFAKKCG